MSYTVYSHSDYEPPWPLVVVETEAEALALALKYRGRSPEGTDYAVMETADFDAWTEHDYDSYP